MIMPDDKPLQLLSITGVVEQHPGEIQLEKSTTSFSPCMFTPRERKKNDLLHGELRAEHNTRLDQQLLQVSRLRLIVLPAPQ